MYPTSQAYKDAVRKSHSKLLTAAVYASGGNTKLLDLYPVDGFVTVDQNSTARRTMELTIAAPRALTTETPIPITYATLFLTYATYTAFGAAISTYGAASISTETITTVVDSGLVPDNVEDALLPYGNEIELKIGVEVNKSTAYNYSQLYSAYATYSVFTSAFGTYGQTKTLSTVERKYEMIPLGRFVITSVSITEGDAGLRVQVSGEDRSLRIRRAKYIDIYQIASGTNAGTALRNALQDRWEDVALSFTDTTATVNATYLGGDTSDDPWVDMQEIAKGIGMNLYFDADGICRLDSIRDYVNATPDAIYEDGEANIITDVTRDINILGSYNAVIVSGEGTGNTSGVFRVEVYDDDPDSPTYRYGGFGVVPYFYTSSVINSTAQAATTAEAILNQIKGASEEIGWSSITDPSLDAGDVVLLVNEGTKVNQLLVLDSITIPLQHNQVMTARGRLVKTVAGGAQIV